MPNWCNNELTVAGPRRDLRRFKKRAADLARHSREENRNVFNFRNLVPIPRSVLKASYDKVGHRWEIKHWGCKWGAFEVTRLNRKGNLVYGFFTPNSPPIGLLQKLGPEWSTLTFTLAFEELDIGFRGRCKVHGEVIEEDWFDLENED